MEYGDAGHKFYIMFKGVVSVSIPNQDIRNWRMRRFEFLQDKAWYETKINMFYDLKRAWNQDAMESPSRKYEENFPTRAKFME